MFGLLLKMVLRGGSRLAVSAGLLPLLGAGPIAASAFLAHSTHAIKAAAAARVELRRLAEIAEQNRAAAHRYKAGMAAARMASKEAAQRAARAQEAMRQARERVMALPQSGTGPCPTDCRLP